MFNDRDNLLRKDYSNPVNKNGFIFIAKTYLFAYIDFEAYKTEEYKGQLRKSGPKEVRAAK